MTFLTVESGDVLSTHEKDDGGQAKIFATVDRLDLQHEIDIIIFAHLSPRGQKHNPFILKTDFR